MKKIKWGKGFKYIFKIFLVAIIVIYSAVIPTTIIPNFLKNKIISSESRKFEFMGVLEVWHIESFEGGSKSRQSWLEQRGIEFSKIHQGCYILINTMSLEQAKLNLQNGKKPNMFSFSIGAGDSLREYLSAYNGKVAVRDDLLAGGKINDTIYAVPYLLGGYSIFSKNEITKELQNVGFGEGNINNFALALALNDYKVAISETSKNIDSFTAYDNYLKGKTSTLVGTQRDSFRINNRLQNGKMANENMSHLGVFSDLIQYMGICTTNELEYEMSKKFIEYLQTTNVQKSISNISMFTANGEYIYNSGYLHEMELSLNKALKTLNVFISDELLKQIHDKSVEYVQGQFKDINYFKNYLVG